MFDQSGQSRCENRSPKHSEGSIFSLWKKIEVIWGILTEFSSQTCKLWVQKALCWTMTKSSLLFISMYAWIMLIFCVLVSVMKAFHWPPQRGPQLYSSLTEICLNSYTIANRANETFLRQVHDWSKITPATGWGALSQLWNGIIRQGPVWAGSEKVSIIESNPIVTCHCQKTCNVHSAQNVVVGVML